MSLRSALPPYDRALSPYTGWTRTHWEVCADWLAGMRANASPSHARVRFPAARARDPVGELESFARTFLLGALRLADLDGGGELASWFAEGLAAGTDPNHREAWPAIKHHDQTLVEATAVALGLHWSRPWLWGAASAGGLTSTLAPLEVDGSPSAVPQVREAEPDTAFGNFVAVPFAIIAPHAGEPAGHKNWR